MRAVPGGRRVRIGASLALRRPRRTAAFLLLGILLGGLTTGTAAVHASGRDAVVAAAAANLGDRGYVLETDDGDAQRVLAGLAGASPVLDSGGYLTSATGTLDATVRYTDDPSLVLGSLVAGERAADPGDVLVTRALARTLGIAAGDDVSLTADADSPEPVHVAGIIADTADAGARTVQVLVESAALSLASRWVSDEEFGSLSPELGAHLQAYTAVASSRSSVTEAALENLPPAVSVLTYVPAAALALVLVLVVAVAAASVRTWSRDVDALVAAGLAPARGWRIIAGVTTATVTTGVILGASLALAVVWWARAPISAALGQDWVGIGVPVGVVLGALSVTVCLGLVAVPVGRRLAARSRRRDAVVGHLRERTLLAGAVAAVAAGVVGYALWPRGGGAVSDTRALALFGAIAFAASVPFLLAGVAGTGLPRATRSLVANLAAPLAAVTAVALTVAVAASSWSALEFSDAALGEAISDGAAQPSGSLLVSAMPAATIDRLAGRYSELGGAAIETYELTSDARAVLRATSPSAIACGDRAGGALGAVSECGEIGLVAIGDPGTGIVAAPSVAEGGSAGLVALVPQDGTVGSSAVVAAVTDADLGYLMPGVVIGADDPAIAELEVTGSGLSMVLLADFASLSVPDRLAMRSFVLTVSPTAQLSDATQPTTYDQIRSTATGAALAGALVAVVMLLLGGGAIVIAQDAPRRALIDIGAAGALRLGVALRWAAVPALSLALGAVLTVAVATGGWRTPSAALSWPWAVAFGVGLAASAAIAWAHLQPPRRPAE